MIDPDDLLGAAYIDLHLWSQIRAAIRAEAAPTPVAHAHGEERPRRLRPVRRATPVALAVAVIVPERAAGGNEAARILSRHGS